MPTKTKCPDDHIVVGIPSYNSEGTIARTLENTLQQTHQAFQVIVYDDGSTDTSPDIVKSFSDRDSRVVLHRNEVNRGRPQARNALLSLASNAIIAWQDADDLWHPSKLSRQVAFYDKMRHKTGHENFALVSSLERLEPLEGGEERGYLSRVLGQDYYGTLHPPSVYDVNYICSDKYMSFPFYLQSTFARAAHFTDAGGFDDKMPWYEDLDMGLRLLRNGTQIFGLKNDFALAYYYSGAPRLPPAVVKNCLLRIYRNNAAFMEKSGIDVSHDLRLRKLTLLFLGMIRKREFEAALHILAEESEAAFRGGKLERLYLANIDVLKNALLAAKSAALHAPQESEPVLVPA